MSNANEILSKVKAAQEELANATKELKADDRAKMKEMFLEIFEKFPTLGAMRIRGGAPSFNDGSPCYFRVGEPEVRGLDPDEDFYGEYDEGPEFEKCEEAHEAFSNVIYAIGDDLMEDIFGEGFIVTITREGIENEWWSPDY